MEPKKYHVYIISSQNNKVLYVGVTGDLVSRAYQHKTKQIEGFTKKYNVTKLVYTEEFNSIEFAIAREKQLKKWHRAWKTQLINKTNPYWEELQTM